MVLNSSLLLLLRSLSAAMLKMVNKRYLVVYMGDDMALYLLQKVARGDFHYWVSIDGALGLFVSLLMRVMAKTITDFTGVIQFRHPLDMGGFYWTVNMFLALVASFASVWLYTKSDVAEVTEKRESWTLLGCMGGGWLLTFALFLVLMKKGFRRTFFCTKSGKQHIMERFMAKDDAAKASILKKNKNMWRPIREDVKEWEPANWWRWTEEKPTWLTKSWIAKVPAEKFPEEAKDAAKVIRASVRRSSFALGLGVAEEEENGRRVAPIAAD